MNPSFIEELDDKEQIMEEEVFIWVYGLFNHLC